MYVSFSPVTRTADTVLLLLPTRSRYKPSPSVWQRDDCSVFVQHTYTNANGHESTHAHTSTSGVRDKGRKYSLLTHTRSCLLYPSPYWQVENGCLIKPSRWFGNDVATHLVTRKTIQSIADCILSTVKIRSSITSCPGQVALMSLQDCSYQSAAGNVEWNGSLTVSPAPGFTSLYGFNKGGSSVLDMRTPFLSVAHNDRVDAFMSLVYSR